MKWRPNVFVAAFVLGAAALTVLPFLQRRFLKAPEPIYTLPPWSLSTSSGEAVSDASLKGRVYLASFIASPCDTECVARQESFGHALPHLDDLDGGLVMVSFSAVAPSPSQPNWYVLGGPNESAVVESFREGWRRWAGTDAGTTPEEFSRLPGYAVVDQTGAVRGFWKDDVAGRGNAINAARLLLRYGVKP
ncbi:MAG: hypothetical protein IPJ65_02640 [Archangiaceae bacterium]|nr:hypothetical protein [Archangiaceae bacterium]